MVSYDGRTLEQIKAILLWSQQDSFWKKNIKSMEKLRKQFDQLMEKSGLLDKFINSSLIKTAKEIYDIHPKKVEESNSIQAILHLLKNGASMEDLRKATLNYVYVVQAKGTEVGYIIQSNNFYRDNKWKDFKELPEEIKGDKDLYG